jgi:hypothetical protein
MGSQPRVLGGSLSPASPGHQVIPDPQTARRARLDEVECRAVSMRIPPPRRDLVARKALRVRILSEFREMPGMSLTAVQAARLFGLPQDVCVRILAELTDAGLLCQRATGAFGLPPAAFTRKAG